MDGHGRVQLSWRKMQSDGLGPMMRDQLISEQGGSPAAVVRLGQRCATVGCYSSWRNSGGAVEELSVLVLG